MSRNKISTHRNKYKNGIQKVHYLQSYIILKDNSIKECILKAVGVNGGHCGRFIPQVVSCNLSLREVSSKRVVRDTRNLPTNSMILHFK